MANEVTLTVRGRDQGAKKVLDETGKSLTNVGNVAKGILAAGFLEQIGRSAQRFLGQAGQAASGLQQAVGGTRAVFGDASRAVDDFAKTSDRSVGLSERAFREATTLIGGQLKRMTGDVEFASDASLQLVEVGADLAATYGGTTKEAVDAFAAALRGEADPAERFNLNLKISEVNAKAVELGLAATTSEVDENAKAQALLALVMEQSADAQGQFARESDTAAGAAQRASAAWENAQARLGEQLLPLLARGGEAVSTLAAGFADLPEPVQGATGAVVLLSAAVLVLTPRIVAAKEALETLGVSAKRLTVALGAPIAIITALATATSIAAQEWQAATLPADKLVEDLERLAASGRQTGLVTELLGRDIGGLSGSLRAAAENAESNWLDRNFIWAPSKREEVNQAVADIAAVDEALAQIAAAGGDSEAAFSALVAAAGLSAEQIDALRAQLPQYAEEQQRANERTRDAEETQKGAVEADLARLESLKAVSDALRAQVDPAFALIDAQQRLAEAQKAVTDAAEEHGRESPQFRAALRDESKAALEVLAAAGELGDEFTGDLSAAQRKMLEDAGLSEQAIEQLASDLRQAKEDADKLDGTRIELHHHVRYTSSGTPFMSSPGGRGGIATGGLVGVGRGMQAGGISGAVSQAQAGGPRGGANVLVGEQGPEIAQLPFGTRVIPAGQTQAMLAGATSERAVTVIHLRSDGTAASELLKELIRHALRADPSFRQDLGELVIS